MAARQAGSATGPDVPATMAEAIDPAWLARALAPASGGAAILSVEVVETLRTMASKVRVAVRFADDPGRVHGYCLKAFLDPEGDPASGGATTTREADFYLDIAPRITMRVPGCAGAVIDRERRRAILIMDDLVAAGARFCSALEPLGVDEVAAGLEQIARLHAAEAVAREVGWLPARVHESVLSNPAYAPAHVQTLLDDPRGDTLDARTRDAGRLFAGLVALADRSAAGPQVVLHGDAHAGNMYRTAAGPGFTDWQTIQRGWWAIDVAYHVSATLPVDVAAREERRLLGHYLQAVRALGGHPPDDEAAWEQFRAGQVYGFFNWAITRRVDPAITRVFTARLGAAVMRHDSYRLLGV